MSRILYTCFTLLTAGALLTGCQESPLSALSGSEGDAPAAEAPAGPAGAAQRAEAGHSSQGYAAVAGVNRKGTYRYGVRADTAAALGDPIPAAAGEPNTGAGDGRPGRSTLLGY